MSFKGAIAGFGFIAKEGHLPAFLDREDVEICAVADTVPERKEEVRALLPKARFYRSMDRLFLEEDLDFLDIATHPAGHFDYIRSALARQWHVLCEKPLVLEAAHFEEIAARLKEGSKTVFTVHNWKHAPIFQKTSELLEAGRIGDIKRIYYEVLRTGPSKAAPSGAKALNWRLKPDLSGGGILADHGWHAFYILCGWMKKSPREVACVLEKRRFKDLEVEDTASVRIEFAGAEVEIFFTWTSAERKNTILIKGTKGELKILDDSIDLTYPEGHEKYDFEGALSKGSHHPEWYPPLLRDFFRSLSNRSVRKKNFEEAEICFKLMAGARESHDKGGGGIPVQLSSFIPRGNAPS